MIQFPGWARSASGLLFTRRGRDGRRAIVTRPDGTSWGWLICDDDGQILGGQIRFGATVHDAIAAAEAALGVTAAPAVT